MDRKQLSSQLSQALLDPADIKSRLEEGVQFLDVRSDEEVAEGALDDAICIPHDQIADRLEEVSEYKDKGMVIFCRKGGRADRVIQYLKSQGYQNLANAGGYDDILEAQG